MDSIECAKFTQLLGKELIPATGCTEPIAIAYGAAIAKKVLEEPARYIVLYLSKNIIKNAKSATVPNTGGRKGIKTALAAGAIIEKPELELEILGSFEGHREEELDLFLEQTKIDIFESPEESLFDIQIKMIGNGNESFVHISEEHTNIIRVEKNQMEVLSGHFNKINNEMFFKDEGKKEKKEDIPEIKVEEILTYIETVPILEIEEIISRQIDYNMQLALEGLQKEYGAKIGSIILKNNGLNLKSKLKAYTAAASDARMGGCALPAVIVAGSGNQGITASVPVIVYGEEKKYPKERIIRAVALSDLLTLYQKKQIGKLSAYCGAISAGCAAAAAISFLDGGGYEDIIHTVVNGVAILSGTICDGAKASCAAKIAMAVEAGMVGYEMFQEGIEFYGGDGILTKGIDNTMENIGKLAQEGMKETDREIMKIMLRNS